MSLLESLLSITVAVLLVIIVICSILLFYCAKTHQKSIDRRKNQTPTHPNRRRDDTTQQPFIAAQETKFRNFTPCDCPYCREIARIQKTRPR